MSFSSVGTRLALTILVVHLLLSSLALNGTGTTTTTTKQASDTSQQTTANKETMRMEDDLTANIVADESSERLAPWLDRVRDQRFIRRLCKCRDHWECEFLTPLYFLCFIVGGSIDRSVDRLVEK